MITNPTKKVINYENEVPEVDSSALGEESDRFQEKEVLNLVAEIKESRG